MIRFPNKNTPLTLVPFNCSEYHVPTRLWKETVINFINIISIFIKQGQNVFSDKLLYVKIMALSRTHNLCLCQVNTCSSDKFYFKYKPKSSWNDIRLKNYTFYSFLCFFKYKLVWTGGVFLKQSKIYLRCFKLKTSYNVFFFNETFLKKIIINKTTFELKGWSMLCFNANVLFKVSFPFCNTTIWLKYGFRCDMG